MLPVSRDSRLKQKFYGVTYTFLPPVGDTELFLVDSITEDYSIEQLRESYSFADKDLKNEYQGKKVAE